MADNTKPKTPVQQKADEITSNALAGTGPPPDPSRTPELYLQYVEANPNATEADLNQAMIVRKAMGSGHTIQPGALQAAAERLLLELDIFSQDARDRIMESRETIYSEVEDEITDEEGDNG